MEKLDPTAIELIKRVDSSAHERHGVLLAEIAELKMMLCGTAKDTKERITICQARFGALEATVGFGRWLFRSALAIATLGFTVLLAPLAVHKITSYWSGKP